MFLGLEKWEKLKLDTESLGHAIERAAVDAEYLGGAFAVTASHAQHLHEVLTLEFVHRQRALGSLGIRLSRFRTFVCSSQYLRR